MSNPYYTHTTYPTPNSPGSSASLRNELENITLGFDLLPTLAANGYKVAMVNSAGTALIASAALQALAITSSTINSTTIGASSPSTGAFTTVSATTFTGAVVGNASTATALATARTIGGTSFDGTANVTSFPAPGAIGGTTPSTGAFTTLSATGATTLSAALTYGGITLSNAVTGTGNMVLSTSPVLVTPNLGTPSTLVGTNITGTAAGLTAGNVTTNANLTGEVTSVGNAATLTNASVIGKVLTGYVSGAGTVAATDSILQAIQKLNGNAATIPNLTGAITSVGNATSLGSFSSANLLGALTDETGTGSAVFATSPTLVTPILGTPTSATLTNATGLPISTGVSGLGTGVATALAVNVGSSGAPVVNGGVLGTPSSGTATNLTGLPISTGVSGLGMGVATFLATPSSANLISALTDETGTGSAVFATSPTLVTPILGTPTSATLTNATGLPLTTGVTGLLPVANGGTATATPSIVAGTNVTVTGTWPNQTIASTASGTGDVVGPASSTDNAFARFDSTTGKLLQNSTGATLSDTGAAVFTGALDVLGNSTAGSNLKLYEDTDNGTNYVAFKAPDTIAADVTWTLPAADGTSAQVLSTNGSGTLSWATAGGGGGITYTTVKTANYTAVANDGVQTNTTSGAFTVTLPATPANGDQVFVVDSFNTWGTNNLTIGRNGSTIEGSATDLVCDITGVSVQCVYNGTTWDIFAQVGGAGGSVVTGPASSTDNAIARFDSTTGKIIQNSVVTIADTTGNVAGVGTLSLGTTLGVGGATPSASGSGITFPATQSASSNANTLDDYEEGTWTPEMSFGNDTTGITYSTQVGTYEKIGRQVTLRCHICFTNNGSGSGIAKLSGFPFTLLAASNAAAAFSIFTDVTLSGTYYASAVPQASSTFAYFRMSDAYMTETQFTNTANFTFMTSYNV